MVKPDETIEVCHAHSGIVTWLKLGGAIIGGLMVIFCGLLSVMWSEQKASTAAILNRVSCLAQASDLEVIEKKVEAIRDEQMRLKWVLEQEKREKR